MLEVRDLHTYYGRSHVLHGVSFTVRRGEAVALLGRNGAGKTTTMSTLAGFLPAARGSVRLQGEELGGLPAFKRVRAGLALVPQSGRVFAGLSVQENLDIVRGRPGGDWSRERVFELFPALAALRRRDAGFLSGGERQMLAVGRALMANPKVLLLDEPSEGLAPLVVQALGELVVRLKGEGLALLLAEQNHRFALAVCERACFIAKGAIHHEGQAGDIAGSELIHEYLGT